MKVLTWGKIFNIWEWWENIAPLEFESMNKKKKAFRKIYIIDKVIQGVRGIFYINMWRARFKNFMGWIEYKDLFTI